ncbi:MAG: ABC transporter ATP-binding protein, partial [Eubacteriales bacterium]
MADVLLEVKNLTKYFDTPRGKLHAVDNVSFSIERGKTLGIVGESGCGKSTTGRAILRLVEPTSGEIMFDGVSVPDLRPRQMREMRKEMQLIFQDPFSSLNPRKTVTQTIEEPIKLTGEYPDSDVRFRRVLELMDIVGLDKRLVNTYPHELDGGRRQRIGIARALAMNPKFIVCDEPVSALDVSIQAQILNLMSEIQKELSLTYIFITHDLSVVKHISDEIAVMYLGQVIEQTSSQALFRNPLHPYTKALLSAIPAPRLRDRGERIILRGEITSPINPQPICRFSNRCNLASDVCTSSPLLLKRS